MYLLRFFCSRRMTSEALIPRTSSGFKLMEMRPLFKVVLVPSAPMKDERLSTAGSRRITLASSCCCSAIAVNEMVSGACEMP